MSNLTAQRTEDHWSATAHLWPGERARAYTFHFTFQDDGAFAAHAQEWREVLTAYPQLDLVPDRWLHLTTQGVGMLGEVDERDLEAIGDYAAFHLAHLPPFEATVDKPAFTPQAVRFEPEPAEPAAAVRDALRTAIGQVLPAVPEPADGFVPHVTIGYGNVEADAAGIIAAIANADIDPTPLWIDHVDLIELRRDEGPYYSWRLLRSLPLGA